MYNTSNNNDMNTFPPPPQAGVTIFVASACCKGTLTREIDVKDLQKCLALQRIHMERDSWMYNYG